MLINFGCSKMLIFSQTKNYSIQLLLKMAIFALNKKNRP